MKKFYFSISLFLFLSFSLNTIAVPNGPKLADLQGDVDIGGKSNLYKTIYGVIEGKNVYEYTLTNSSGMIVKVINYGGTITDIIAPDKKGEMASVVLGFDSLEEYTGRKNALMGATVGRVANRISNAKFTLDGNEYDLSSNIHGGVGGFHRRVWNIEEVPGSNVVALRMTYRSVDGEEGYPGNLYVMVTYSLTNENELKIDYTATTDKATPVVLTNHTYFNLSGGNEPTILNTELCIMADQYLEVTDKNIPTGKIFDVKETPFDFTKMHAIGDQIGNITNSSGYDLTYVLKNQSGKLAKAATAFDPKSGRILEVYTTEPGIVFYTGNHLNERTIGRGGISFTKFGAFCLETQHFPDSPNIPHFPNCILRPGETFESQTIYKFSIKAK